MSNPDYDPALVSEGITCAVCHVRKDNDGKGVIIGPRGSKSAPHRVKKDTKHLETICHRCHDPGPVEITPQFFCWFESRRENASNKGCVDCHMPKANAVPAVGQPAREIASHWWRGGGPPKTTDRPPGDVGLKISATRTGDVVKVVLEHDGAGHFVPSGDPERHLLVKVTSGRTTRETFIGQRWDFGQAKKRPAKKLEDNRIKPGERRELSFTAAGQATVVVEHVRVSEENAGYMAQTTLHKEVRAILKDGGLDPDKVQADLRAFAKHQPLSRELFRETL